MRPSGWLALGTDSEWRKTTDSVEKLFFGPCSKFWPIFRVFQQNRLDGDIAEFCAAPM
jgi:hypothetical protein